MLKTTRRRFLAGTAAGAAAAFLPQRPLLAQSGQTILSINTRTIEVKGRAAVVYSLDNPSGGQGLYFNEGDRFNVRLDNYLGEQSLVHWHGMALPWRQDGVPGISADPLDPGGSVAYDYALKPAGTHWMHSHFGLQEQGMMTAPLIVRRSSEVAEDRQEVVIMLNDFSFTPAEELMANLMSGQASASGHSHGTDDDHGAAAAPAPASSTGDMAGMPGMGNESGGMEAMPGMGQDSGGMAGMDHGPTAAPAADPAAPSDGGMAGMNQPGMVMDLNDIDYDAYLANDRTLDDPEIVPVERGGRVRLRIINGASATHFLIDLGSATGQLEAVDGSQVEPVSGSRFPIAIAQRLDILLDMPADGSALPVLALREGALERTGVILAPPGAAVAAVSGTGESKTPPLDFALEASLRARSPLAVRAADRTLSFDLYGAMQGYVWSIGGINGGLTVREGERVELTMRNKSGMAHPMHLHGHTFQVVGLDAERFPGAMRDSLLVPAGKDVTIAFDADNPGRWLLHCHNLYHMEAGMVTTLAYDTYS